MEWFSQITTEFKASFLHWPLSLPEILAWIGFLSSLGTIYVILKRGYVLLALGTLVGWKLPRAVLMMRRETDATLTAIRMFEDGPIRVQQMVVFTVSQLMLNISSGVILAIIALQSDTPGWARLPITFATILIMFDGRRFIRKQLKAFRLAADLAQPVGIDEHQRAIDKMVENQTKASELRWPMSIAFKRFDMALKDYIAASQHYIRIAEAQETNSAVIFD